MPDTIRVRIEDLRIAPNMPAGMDYATIGGLLKRLRATTDDWDPIVVRREPDGTYRVCDGRHRFFASVIAGRPDILAVEEEMVP